MRNGRVVHSVMPEEYPERVESFDDLTRFFQCHEVNLKSDLVAVGTIYNYQNLSCFDESYRLVIYSFYFTCSCT